MKKVGEEFARIYKSLDRCIVWVSWSILLVSVVFDVVPCPYFYKWIEDLFSYEMGDILGITLVIWTFITALLIYYIEHIKERCYGVRLIDSLQVEENYDRLRNKLYLFVVELLLLIVVAILGLPITLAVLTLLIYIFMIYAMTLIYYHTSHERIMELIKQQFVSVLNKVAGEDEENDIQVLCEQRLLIQMIARLDYANEEEANRLLDMLKAELKNYNEKYRYAIKHLTKLMLRSKGKREESFSVVQDWFKSGDTCIECKCEILKALIEEGDKSHFEFCEKLLHTIKERDERRRMEILFIAYNDILKECVGQTYRDVCIRRAQAKLGRLTSSDQKFYRKIHGKLRREVRE